MRFYIETDRLVLRDLIAEDTGDLFVLDSDPLVHRYLGNKPIKCLSKARYYVDYIQMQYDMFGIGRWSTIEKSSGAFIGWSGLKMNFEKPLNNHTNFYDIGYRFIPKYWGKGYATEASIAAKDYFFKHFPNEKLCGMAELENIASCRVLEKIGLERKENFWFEPENLELAWFELQK